MANIFLVSYTLLLFHSPKGSWKITKYEKLGKYWSYCTRNHAITNAYQELQYLLKPETTNLRNRLWTKVARDILSTSSFLDLPSIKINWHSLTSFSLQIKVRNIRSQDVTSGCDIRECVKKYESKNSFCHAYLPLYFDHILITFCKKHCTKNEVFH